MLVLVILSFVWLGFGIDLEGAVKETLKRNPEIKAMQERLGVFEGKKRSATAFPNPEVRLESGFLTTTKENRPKGRALNLLEFDQPLPLWGVREKRKRVVEKEKEAFLYTFEARKREILAEVYAKFFRALYAKEVLKIQEMNYRTAKEIENFVRRAYKLGEATELEFLRAIRERQAERVNLELAKANYEARLKELSGVIGTEVKEVSGKLHTYPKYRDISLARTPRVLALRKKIEAVNEEIKLQKALAKPPVTAGFVVEESEGESFYGFRASISFGIPLFYRRQGEITSLISLRRSLEKEVEAEILRMNSTLSSAKIKMNTLKRELENLQNEVLPNARKELELALKSYRLRAITLLELSDVRRRYYELLKKEAELFLMLHEAYAQLIKIGGLR